MGRFTRAALITGIALFTEGFALYLACRLLAHALRLPDAAIPLPLAMLAVGWSFILSRYVQTIRFSLNLRGVIGLLLSAASVLALAGASLGWGGASFGAVFAGDIYAIASVGLTVAFLVALWWRGTAVARDDVTMDVVRNAFIRGVVIAIIAAAADLLLPARIIGMPLLLGYFAIGLAGLSLSRFTAEDATGYMNRGWLSAIGVGIAGLLLLALILGALGVGGLDDLARAALRGLNWLALWILRPLLLLLGLVAAGLVALGNWISGYFGGGDLSGLETARAQIEEFHESLRDIEGGGPPILALTLAKWLALLAAFALAGWVLFRLFRHRRLAGGDYANGETRESLFSWQGAGQDIADTLGGWLNRGAGLRRRRTNPSNPRAVYHRMLEIAGALGMPRRRGQTPHEHRQDLANTLPQPPVERIVDGFQQYYYGPDNAADDSANMPALLRDLDDIEPRG